MTIVTVLLRASRGALGDAHAVPVYLLVVLFGSLHGGRPLAFTLAAAGVVLVDYFFQLPYDQFGVGKRPDLAELLAFLATAAVTSELVTRVVSAAEAARRRADEVARLSRLGSQALHAGRAQDALAALAEVIRGTLGVPHCEIYRQAEGAALVASAAQARSDGDAVADDAGELVAWVAAHGRAAIVRADGSAVRAATPGFAGGGGDDVIGVAVADARTVIVPLQVEARTVGVLRIADRQPIALDAARRRFLSALAYYAALGVERVRLVAETERAEALREADRLKDIVLATVSHDLRTPLTAIKALAQAAAVRGDTNARVIEEQVDRLSRFVGDMLDLSRLKGGVFPVTLEPNTAEDVVGALTRQLQPLLAGRSLAAAIDMSQPALVGRFDFVQTLRILSNLTENALRYSPPDAPVEIGVTRRGRFLVFTVADRGPGVPPEERERIFAPFYRSAAAAPDGAGGGRAGLGLSIARRLAEAQGGSVRYEPRPGGGSSFILEVEALDPPPGETDDV
jgi:two-component system sensor histidine kinase KdpD